MKFNFYIAGAIFIIICIIVIVILLTMNSNKEACMSAKKIKCTEEPDYIEIPDKPTIIQNYNPSN